MADGDRERWVTWSALFGTDRVPLEAGTVIRRAVDRMVRDGDVSRNARWQAVEFWAADWEAGAEREVRARHGEQEDG